MSVDFKEVKDYYNSTYYAELEGGRPTSHYDIYLKNLGIEGQYKNQNFLDIACGVGHLLSRAEQKGFNCFGIDISDKAIAHAKKKFPSFDLRVGVAEELPWEANTFDYLTCLGSLEHFLNQEAAIKEMIRVAKKDCKLLIMVPNVDFPNWTGTEQQKIKETLLSYNDWKAFLEKNNLKILQVYPDRWPIKWITLPLSNPIQLIRGLYKRYKFWSLPIEKSYQLMFICQPIKPNGSPKIKKQ